ALDGVRQAIALELDVLVVALRDHALVGGELSVDHARDQQPAADVEEQMVLAALVADVLFAFLQQTRELAKGFLRKNRADLVGVLRFAVARNGDEREAVAVGGDEAHRLWAQHEERAVEKVSRVLAGDGKLCLRHHFLQRRARQRRARRAPRFGKRREVFARQGLHPRIESIGGHFYAALVLGDSNVGFRQRLDDFVELLGGKRQRAAFRDRGGAFTAQAHLEIGGKKAHLIAVGVHQHAAEDGNRIF